jgi:hypothetical protein
MLGSASIAIAPATLLAATMGAGVIGAAAGPSLSITPTSGPIGTVISVMGTCTPSDGTPTIQLQQGQMNVFIFSRDVQLTPDGHLTGTIVIPADHPLSPMSPDTRVPVAPGDSFVVAATCDSQGVDYFSSPEPFVVTAPPATTVAPTVAPTTVAPTSAQPTVASSAATVGAGGAVNLNGGGFAANTPLTIELHSAPIHLGTTTSRADGTYSTTVTIPSGTAAGTHSIVVSGRDAQGATRAVATTITVTAAVVAATPVSARPTYTG